MEIIRGKQASFIDGLALADMVSRHAQVHIDIGTGDGRYVQHLARVHPTALVIGLDACRENLHASSQRAPDNALFVIANALALPVELRGLATRITVNFPWGSLIEGLLTPDAALLEGLRGICRPGAALEVRLNGGALAECGWSLEAGAERVRMVLHAQGFAMRPVAQWTACDLKTCPTTWAKRLAFGRDPRAAYLCGTLRNR